MCPESLMSFAESAPQCGYRLRRQSFGVFGTSPPHPTLVHGRCVPAVHSHSVLKACQPQCSHVQYSGEPLELPIGEMDMLAAKNDQSERDHDQPPDPLVRIPAKGYWKLQLNWIAVHTDIVDLG